MRKQILCLCTAILLFFSGCGNPTTEQNKTNSTTSTTTTVTTTTSASLVSTTTNERVTTTATTTGGSQSATSNISGTHPTTITTTLNGNITTQAVTTTQSTATATTVAAPEEITFKATVRVSGQNKTLEGITVTVYTNGNPIPAGSGTTDAKGVANITLLKSNSYRVVLSNLPNGYEANDIFASSTVNITIRKAAVQNEADHSQAQYAVGKKMTNFTLMDTDGNTYKLYDLLEENQLVILDFWFTTCEPCKSEFPYFETVANTYSDKMKLLAINPINNTNDITRFRKQLNANSKTAVTFPMMKDTCNLYLGFGVSTYPTTVFIDSSGTIRDIHIGAYDSEMAFLTAVKRYI